MPALKIDVPSLATNRVLDDCTVIHVVLAGFGAPIAPGYEQ